MISPPGKSLLTFQQTALRSPPGEDFITHLLTQVKHFSDPMVLARPKGPFARKTQTNLLVNQILSSSITVHNTFFIIIVCLFLSLFLELDIRFIYLMEKHFILNTAVCTYLSQTPNLSLPQPFPWFTYFKPLLKCELLDVGTAYLFRFPV